MRVRLRLYRIAFVAGAIAAGAVAIVEWRGSRPIPHLSEAALKVGWRVVDGRLSGFAYVRSGVTRGSERSTPALLRLRGIAGAIIEASEHASDAENLHARGVAQLVAGDAAAAVHTLGDLAHQAKSSSTFWNDLAVAEIQLAREHDDVTSLVSALAAADRALEANPASVEARFNRALALDRLGFRQASLRAYDGYLDVDSVSEWAKDAAEARRALAPAVSIVDWLDMRKLLARYLLQGNETSVLAAVCDHRQLARGLGENVALSAFGDAWLLGQTQSAGRELAFARVVGTALIRCNGESLLHDAVAVVDDAIGRRDTAAVRILVSAHAEYGRARQANAKRDVTTSEAMFAASQGKFTAGGSPMALVAEYFRANNLVNKGRSAEAADIGQRLLSRLPERYPALRAQTLWLQGTALGSLGRVYESLSSYEAARLLFRRIGEPANEMQMAQMEATELTVLGRDNDAWKLRRSAAAFASDIGDNALIEATLDSAARYEMMHRHWDIALSCVNVCLDVARSSNQRRRVDALVRRALANHQLGNSLAAVSDLARARLAATAVDPALRPEAFADIDSTEAIIIRPTNPAKSAELSTQAISFAIAHDRTLDLPHLYFERAADYADLRRKSDRIADLYRAVDLLDERGKRIEQAVLRDSFLGNTTEAYDELAGALWDNHDYASAFAVSERARARTLLDRVGAETKGEPMSQLAVQQALSDGTLLLHYTSLPDRLLIFSMTRTGQASHAIPISREQLHNDADAFADAVEHSRADARERGAALYRLLVHVAAPDILLCKRVIFVPDDVIMSVPFAALVDPQSGKYCIEQTELAIAPSASIYIRLAARHDRYHSALLVGDVDFDASRHPGLPPLPGAAHEIRELKELYLTAAVALTKSQATPAEVLRLLEKADILHIATHVITERETSLSSILLASGKNDNGLLYLHQLVEGPPRDGGIAVLAGCRTGANAGRGAINNFAFAFLAGGYTTVVATLWNVDDRTAQNVSIPFHRLLQHGMAPTAALRKTQLEMLRSSDPSLREPRAWSAYQIFGS